MPCPLHSTTSVVSGQSALAYVPIKPVDNRGTLRIDLGPICGDQCQELIWSTHIISDLTFVRHLCVCWKLECGRPGKSRLHGRVHHRIDVGRGKPGIGGLIDDMSDVENYAPSFR